jgi:hypothetical protein
VRIEEREGWPVLVDEEGVEVMPGNPLCVDSLTYLSADGSRNAETMLQGRGYCS